MPFTKGHTIWVGRKHSKETKKKIGLAHKGKVKSPETIEKHRKKMLGHPQWNTGKTHFKSGHVMSEETKQKIRETMIVKGIKPPSHKGKNNYQWKGGITQTKEYKNFYKNQYKYRKRNATGSHTRQEWEGILKEHKYSCAYCERSNQEVEITVDHIIPISRGGTNHANNLQPLCRSCNGRKINKIQGDDYVVL